MEVIEGEGTVENGADGALSCCLSACSGCTGSVWQSLNSSQLVKHPYY
jgi:hypothetical protein